MFTVNICVSRIPGKTQVQFRRYAIDNHARLVLGTTNVSRFITRYVQHHVYDGSYGPDAPRWRYDVATHVSSRSLEDMVAARQQPDYINIVRPDESRFAHQDSVMAFAAIQVPLLVTVPGPSRFRLLHYLKRASDIPAERFREQWERAHASVLTFSPRLSTVVRRALLSYALPDPSGESPYAGVVEIGFVEKEDAALLTDYVLQVEERLQACIEHSASFYLLAEAVLLRGDVDGVGTNAGSGYRG